MKNEISIKIDGEINDELTREVVGKLEAIYDYNQDILSTYIEPIGIVECVELEINSFGGDLAGFIKIKKIVDKLKEMGVLVKTYGDAYVQSCGFLLLLLGEERDCSPFSSLMLHEGRTGMVTNITGGARFFEHQRHIQHEMNKFICSVTDISMEFLEENKDVDVYLNRDEALKLGVLTKPKEKKKPMITLTQLIETYKVNGYEVYNDLVFDDVEDEVDEVFNDVIFDGAEEEVKDEVDECMELEEVNDEVEEVNDEVNDIEEEKKYEKCGCVPKVKMPVKKNKK